MAVSSGRYRNDGIKWLCVWTVVYMLCVQAGPSLAKKHKHPPVVAFFQGHCNDNFCDQKCRNIDGVGYACECYHGYKVNHDGITCTKISSQSDDEAPVVELKRPDTVKVITLQDEKESLPDITVPVKDKTDINLLSLDGKHSMLYKVPPTDSENSVREDSRAPGGDIDGENSVETGTGSKDKLTDTNDDVKLSHDVPLIHLTLPDKDHHRLVDADKVKDIKIETYDQKLGLPSLETDSLRTDDSYRPENVQGLVPNPIPKYSMAAKQRPSAYFDNKSSGVRCDEFSCLNNGKCVDDGTVHRYKLRCDCLLGTVGEKCEKEVDVRYPRFYGNSFLALPVLRNGYKELDLLIEFKPIAKYGLLFFSSEFEDAKTDFFSVSLIDGFVELRYDCGTGMGIVRSQTPALDNEWNTLRIHREDNFATLWLNQDKPVHGQSQGEYSRLTLRLHLYIGGYQKMGIIGTKVGTPKGFVGCVEQVVVNGYKYDLRKGELVGDAQFGANVGECSEGVCETVTCHNNGLCQVISADRHVCLCPIGTGGENCQHRTSVHIPEFQGHSYLEYVGLGRSALLFLEVELVIKPSKPDGLILYNGYTLDRKGDFVSLALDKGHLEFRFDLGTGPAVIRSSEPVTMNQWHWIKLSRTGMEGVLEIDDKIAGMGQSEGAFTQLTVTQNLFIGGHRNFDETSQSANVTRSFDGCIQKIVINNQPLRLISDTIFGVNIESCEHPCVGQPCLNNGECMPRKDVYTCYCPLGYTGINCQKKMDKDISSPRFTSDSYLLYSQKRVSKRIGGDRIDIRFSIKPETTNGLLFWSGPDIMVSTSDYIAIGFVDGALQFRYNLGSGEAVISYNNSRLLDGMWHNVHAQRDKQDGFLSVDGREIVEGSSKGSYTMLNTNKVLFIGGMPDVSQNTLKKFTSGFQGCLRDFVLGEDLPLHLLGAADTGRNVMPCV